MRIGTFLFPSTIDRFVEEVRVAAEQGFATVWTPQIFGHDALSAIAVAGSHVPGIRFGTAVVPTYPRHPAALAQMALTAQAATKGRLSLGIGLSHKVVIEGMYGMSFDKPAKHMREYLSILVPLVRDRQVSYAGESLTYRGNVQISDADPMPVLLAALAPEMLKLAGSVADGTITWMTGPRTVADHIIPSMTAGANAAGRPSPTTVVGLPICLTSAVDAARETAAKEYVIYGQLPSYRAMLDREGAAGPADVALIGDEATIAASIRRLADSGVDELCGNVFGSSEERARTNAFLSGLV